MVERKGVDRLRAQFQHEIFGLKDEEAIKVLIELAEEILSLLELKVPPGDGLWNVIKSRVENPQHDYAQHYLGYLIGLRTAQRMLCSTPCSSCNYKEGCPLHQEIKFMGEIMYYLKTKGREGAEKFIRERIEKIRKELGLRRDIDDF